MNDKCKIR